MRDALSLLISLKGMRASVFASAEDFLAVHDHSWRGCLLTDLKMPGMNGLDLQTVLREKCVTLPVVVRDVLDLLAEGLQHREIAERLSISPRTVEVYKARMMDKLGCRTLADVMRIGTEARSGRHTPRASNY